MAEEKPTRRLVVIEDGLLLTMSASPEYASKFPFLAGLKDRAESSQPRKAGCQKCRQRSEARRTVFNAAKAAIAGMGREAKELMKQMLNATEIRVRYTDGPKTFERTI